MVKLTPMMHQYMEMKKKYRDAILFFRMGDFYEMFGEDAIIASKVLNITLTSRNTGPNPDMPMAGVPHHAVGRYLKKMLQAGYKVALCDQLEDPKKAKGLVKRDVVRVFTPGTIIEEEFLDTISNNFLMGIRASDYVYLSFIDLSTGEFLVTKIERHEIEDILNEIRKYSPSEALISSQDEYAREILDRLKGELNIFITELPDTRFNRELAERELLSLFSLSDLEAQGLDEDMISLCGAVISYLKETYMSALTHISRVVVYEPSQYLVLDGNTPKNLELVRNLADGSEKSTLFSILRETLTPMGTRLLRKTILQPLRKTDEIRKRLSLVEVLYEDKFLRYDLRSYLSQISDIERILTKINHGSVTPKDLVLLKKSLSQLPRIKEIISQSDRADIIEREITGRINTLGSVVSLIENAIVDDPPANMKDGGFIKKGFSAELDELREIASKGKEWLKTLAEREKEKTGIKSLKIGYNKVFGYYIEVSKANLHLVPENYIRKQTLANAERFITPELKEYEEKILNAEEKISELEYDIFSRIREEILKYNKIIQENAALIAYLDMLCSFAEVSAKYGYCKPLVDDSDIIEIREGRHPVVEQTVTEEGYIPNDTVMDCNENRVIILTGPNMAGKSTYMRQVALIVIMAQMGCYVPAKYARIGVVDKIFTRIGAQDNLASGQSTFMVEMVETATILRNATRKSLILLDEVGRGTSTFDGMSIAWGVIEYIHNRIHARTLFATHYHELTCLEKLLPGVKNYNITVSEHKGEIIFLRKVVRGAADKSYGIAVAKLAHLPDEVIKRASEILSSLERKESKSITEKLRTTSREKNILEDINESYKEKQTRLFDFVG